MLMCVLLDIGNAGAAFAREVDASNEIDVELYLFG